MVDGQNVIIGENETTRTDAQNSTLVSFSSASTLCALEDTSTDAFLCAMETEEFVFFQPSRKVERKATTADLIVQNLVAVTSQPFRLNTAAILKIQVGNIGSVAASIVELTLHIDGYAIGTSSIGSLNPGIGKNVQLEITGKVGGLRDVQVSVNDARKVPESNYSNNSVGGSYLWAGFNGICAYSL